MQLVDCPGFEYKDHPQHEPVLKERTAELMRGLRSGALTTAALVADSRPIHRRLFLKLTPPGCDYYAGHYRGELFRCLRLYEVEIAGDQQVGWPPATVPMVLSDLAKEILAGVAALDQVHQLPNAHVLPKDKLVYTVVFACRIFEFFLRVHPYANGNGHAARYIVWSILGRYGYWLQNWPIDPQPPNPPYLFLLQQHRAGNRDLLEQFMMQALLT